MDIKSSYKSKTSTCTYTNLKFVSKALHHPLGWCITYGDRSPVAQRASGDASNLCVTYFNVLGSDTLINRLVYTLIWLHNPPKQRSLFIKLDSFICLIYTRVCSIKINNTLFKNKDLCSVFFVVTEWQSNILKLRHNQIQDWYVFCFLLLCHTSTNFLAPYRHSKRKCLQFFYLCHNNVKVHHRLEKTF